ncbi:hypothetical protein BDK51DRAFT_38178 [Blyttiomyces helicus]|uniref:Uncharacterized protein n=1 Tax=Blyttiomyces helicus TaxID=388810 RepID=A0A4P9W617_9FUNG|nr:hypothetical protein BDK51DRAFT_38178 [Blyttiomyces helicus]|eukprot:RKO86793.1 hypothetical protein BDK51DRAFT_38178 [Blyttiomyces helicus]
MPTPNLSASPTLRAATHSLHEISNLQTHLAHHLQTQQQQIDTLYDQASESTATIASANAQLENAQRNLGDTRIWVLLFLLIASGVLVFLDYYGTRSGRWGICLPYEYLQRLEHATLRSTSEANPVHPVWIFVAGFAKNQIRSILSNQPATYPASCTDCNGSTETFGTIETFPANLGHLQTKDPQQPTSPIPLSQFLNSVLEPPAPNSPLAKTWKSIAAALEAQKVFVEAQLQSQGNITAKLTGNLAALTARYEALAALATTTPPRVPPATTPPAGQNPTYSDAARRGQIEKARLNILRGRDTSGRPMPYSRPTFSRMVHDPNQIQNPHLKDAVNELQLLHFRGIKKAPYGVVRTGLRLLSVDTKFVRNNSFIGQSVCELAETNTEAPAICAKLTKHEIIEKVDFNPFSPENIKRDALTAALDADANLIARRLLSERVAQTARSSPIASAPSAPATAAPERTAPSNRPTLANFLPIPVTGHTDEDMGDHDDRDSSIEQSGAAL